MVGHLNEPLANGDGRSMIAHPLLANGRIYPSDYWQIVG
jgi:hypothetical protein